MEPTTETTKTSATQRWMMREFKETHPAQHIVKTDSENFEAHMMHIVTEEYMDLRNGKHLKFTRTWELANEDYGHYLHMDQIAPVEYEEVETVPAP